MNGACWRLQQEQDERLSLIEETQMIYWKEFGDKIIPLPGTGAVGVVLSDKPTSMRLWDLENENRCFGEVPTDFTPEQVTVAVKIYHQGHRDGEARARNHIETEMLKFFSL
jgi:hypothetical protein